MKIAVDIDGVLTELEEYVDREAASFFGKSIVNSAGQELDERYGVSSEDCDKFWDAVFYDYIDNCKAKKDVDKAVSRLMEDGNELFIMTARKFYPQYGFTSPDDMREHTFEWLRKHGIKYDHYVEAPAPKVKEVLENGIDVMIDDEIQNIEALSKVTKVIIMDADYNRCLNLDNTYRAHSWEEVYEIIGDLSRNKND